MSDEADTGDASNNDTKHSKRAFLKGAITRTRSKFKKSEHNEESKEFKLSDDVNEFLAAGRTSTPTRLSPSPSQTYVAPPQTSPRGVPVPRLDISQSTRWPGARPVESNIKPDNGVHLKPYDADRRSRSVSSLKKNNTKPRNLSVSFVSAPPTIIGEGGDESEIPVAEISRARLRARSLSPIPNRPTSSLSNSSAERSPSYRKPLPQASQAVPDVGDLDFVPKPIRRAQTGFNEPIRSIADKEFEQVLKPLDSASTDELDSPFKTPIVAPVPKRAPIPPPVVPGDPQTTTYIADVRSNDSIKTSMVQVTLTGSDNSGDSHSETPYHPPPLRGSPNIIAPVPHKPFVHLQRHLPDAR